MIDPALDLVVRAGSAVLPGGVRPADVGVRDGRVAVVAGIGTTYAAKTVDLADDEVLLPGLVDTHVHVNEPGRTDWEGFASATRAAAAGGVTTIVDMPLNSIPPTVDVTALEVKRSAATAAGLHVDVGFWGGLVPGNLAQLAPLHAAGVMGVKCFLLPSGVEEFPPVSAAQLRAGLDVLAGLGALTLVHAEDGSVVRAAPSGPRYADFLASRPPAAEVAAVRTLVDAAERSGARVHVVHVSSADVLELISDARLRGVGITAETCPHYLTLTSAEVPDGATAFKCCPPIRDADNRDRLWAGLLHGVLDVVVSDHSPSPPDVKALGSGDFGAAWGGISSLQLGLALVWTEARRRGIGLDRVVRWMSQGPADLVGLGRKGRIAVGADADLVRFAPEETFTVDPAALHHRHPLTPYAGRTLSGVVRETWLRGEDAPGDRPRGALLRR
ncbi:MAG: allantoinase [Actinomycetota bacterium]|nr:allantoinase [Actinomycetota bacterium]